MKSEEWLEREKLGEEEEKEKKGRIDVYFTDFLLELHLDDSE